MDQPIIEVEHLSKLYRLGVIGSTTLQESIERWWYRLRGKEEQLRKVGTKHLMIQPGDPQAGPEPNSIWALRDVSFTVEQGEIVGVIGKNGAGKSTLLKILTRITEPTTGRAIVRGRVASLLEVGTGFHPELTGRENVYLNGAILGMTRSEIAAKFDEIVEFSGVEHFIDTPVKRYSSGMYVRLAFAVAAHLEPEILLVDEVLAVGDAEFQKKCLGKMKEVSEGGRTVLFVSHNMAAILSLCNKTYLLDQGHIVCEGATEDVVAQYMQSGSSSAKIPLHERTDRNGDGSVRLTSISIDGGAGGSPIKCSDRFRIIIGYTSKTELKNATFLVGIYDSFNRPIFFLDSEMGGGLPKILPSSGFVTCVTSPINLTPGSCSVNLAVLVGGVMADNVKQACSFEVMADDFYGTGKLTARQLALCLLGQEWHGQDNQDDEYSV